MKYSPSSIRRAEGGNSYFGVAYFFADILKIKQRPNYFSVSTTGFISWR
jgi:hypothetical protein